jgi:hypothetical protein
MMKYLSPGEDIRRIHLDVWAVPQVCAPHFLHDSVRVNTSLAIILLLMIHPLKENVAPRSSNGRAEASYDS